MTVPFLQWQERPQLNDPIVVCAFRGWNDAGEAASAAVQFLVESFEARVIAEIDPEDFYDFTAVRPTVRLVEGRTRTIDWPKNVFQAAQIPGADHDLVLVQGVEPSLRWRAYCSAVHEVAEATGARMLVTLGALLADVPHSRPVSVTGLASTEGLVDRLGFQVTAAVATDPDVKAFVERLEEMADEMDEDDEPPRPENLPSGDTIAREFQRFLRQRGPEDPTGP